MGTAPNGTGGEDETAVCVRCGDDLSADEEHGDNECAGVLAMRILHCDLNPDNVPAELDRLVAVRLYASHVWSSLLKLDQADPGMREEILVVLASEAAEARAVPPWVVKLLAGRSASARA